MKSREQRKAAVAEMIATCEWDDDVDALHFSAVYDVMHEKVYGVTPTDAGPKTDAAAAALIDAEFGGNVMAAVEFAIWLWNRETKRERWRREEKQPGKRITWQWFFSANAVTDYRVEMQRAGKHLPAPAASVATPVDEDWKSALDWVERRGKPRALRPTINNIQLVLVHDPRWAGVLAIDEFIGDITTTRIPPWHDDLAPAGRNVGEWRDDDVPRLCAWLSREYACDAGTTAALHAAALAAAKKIVHPVRDYLRSLVWDGEARIDTWLADFCRATEDDYSRAVGAKFLIAAVARIMQPGVKVDTMLVLEGKQGALKSTAALTLGGEKWTLEMAPEFGTKDGYQVLRRKWVVEIPELEAMSRADASKAKAFISHRTDTYRPSYGRGSVDFPRQCVFIGTTNAEHYLKDDTGGRRFWPVRVRSIDIAGLAAARDQLWAEARVRFERGEAWHVTDQKLLERFEAEQADRHIADPREEAIHDWLREPSQEGVRRRANGVTTIDVLQGALKLPIKQCVRADQMLAAAALARAGWARDGRQSRRDGKQVRLYRPEDVAGRDGVVTRVRPLKKGRSSTLSQPSQPIPGSRGGKQDQGSDDTPTISETGRDGCDVVTAPARPLRRRSEAVKLKVVAGGGGG